MEIFFSPRNTTSKINLNTVNYSTLYSLFLIALMMIKPLERVLTCIKMLFPHLIFKHKCIYNREGLQFSVEENILCCSLKSVLDCGFGKSYQL